MNKQALGGLVGRVVVFRCKLGVLADPGYITQAAPDAHSSIFGPGRWFKGAAPVSEGRTDAGELDRWALVDSRLE